MLPGCYDTLGVLASGSSLAATAWGCACGRCLIIALDPGPGFPFVSLPLSLVEGSSDGLAASVRSLSPGRLCLTHSVCVEFRLLCAISLLGLAFLAPLGLTVDFCRIQWRRSSRKLLRFPCGWGLSVLSLDRVLLTSSLSSPGCSRLGLSWLPLMGFDFAGLVASGSAELDSAQSFRSVRSLRHILAFVHCELGSPLVPSLVAALLG